jgi:hypothetical protein
MDNINKALMLELAYRLTIAVNISTHKLEPLFWMDSWHEKSLACAKKWNKHLLATIVTRGDAESVILGEVANIIEGLSPGYAAISGNSFDSSQDSKTYGMLLDIAHRIAYAPVLVEWELSEFFMLGQQLAQNDLRAHFAAINKPDLRVLVYRQPPFEPLSEKSFPRQWPKWPADSAFNECLVRYVANRQRLVDPASFSMGPLANLMRSIVCPTHFPATAWCWKDWENGEPWRLFLAGELFPQPTLVTVKNPNDKAFVLLLERMDEDKKEGRRANDCGWMLRNNLWPGKSPNTCSKAWGALKKTLAMLGDFEFNGEVGKNKDTGGLCRAPAALAGPGCRIFIEQLK